MNYKQDEQFPEVLYVTIEEDRSADAVYYLAHTDYKTAELENDQPIAEYRLVARAKVRTETSLVGVRAVKRR